MVIWHLVPGLALGGLGAPCVLVERHPDLLQHPRSRGPTPRTMEVHRQADLERAILDATFAGPGFATISCRPPPSTTPSTGSRTSPPRTTAPASARRLGAELRFSSELASFTQNDQTVTAELTDRAAGATEVLEEIGCGHGVAATMVCERLQAGASRLTAA